jgi:hypothetical protein
MKLWTILAAAFALVLAGSGSAWAVISDCPDAGGTKFIVDTAPEAANMADGYSNVNCDLEILTSITPTNSNYTIGAKSVLIQGPDVLNAAQRASIVSNLGGGKIFITANGGGVTMNEAAVKAKEFVKIACVPAGCDVDISLSDVIASSTLNFGDPGGTLEIIAKDALTMVSSTIYGGSLVTVSSLQGSVTWICQPGAGGCKSPLNEPGGSNVVAQLLHQGGPATCADQFAANQPCTVTFATAADLKAVCIQAPGVNCGGGSKELHIFAFKDIHLENTQIVSSGTFVIAAGKNGTSGRIFGANANLTAGKFDISARGDGVNTAIDFTTAVLSAPGQLRMFAKTCPAPLAICINLDGADISIKSSTRLPTINGTEVEPYVNFVLDEPAECGGAGADVNNAAAVISAASATGVVSICGTLINAP